MANEETGLINQTTEGARVDTGAIPPPQAPPQLNDFQKAFEQQFGSNEVMKRFASLENPFTAVAEELSKTGNVESGLKLVTDNSTPEEVAAFRKAIGAFEKAEDYKYDLPSSEEEAIKKLLPSEAPYIKAFQEIALKTNMPESTWKEMMSAYNQMMIEDAKTTAELSSKALEAVKENWTKTHGEQAPKIESVFQKYFSKASPAESQILSTLNAEQLAAVGSVVYRQEKKLGSEDSIDTKNIGSDTLSDVDYVSEQSKLLTRKRELESQGQAWGSEAQEIKRKLDQLADRYKNSRKS